MSDITIPGGKIRSFVERIENLDSEMQELSEQKKEVFAEAKGEGFDVKILREIIRIITITNTKNNNKNNHDDDNNLSPFVLSVSPSNVFLSG